MKEHPIPAGLVAVHFHTRREPVNLRRGLEALLRGEEPQPHEMRAVLELVKVLP